MFKVYRVKLTFISVFAMLIALVTPIWKLDSAHAIASANVAGVYLEAPLVQGSYALEYGGQTENFDTRTAGSIGAGTVLNVGTIASGTITVGTTGYGASSESSSATFGGSLTNYATAASSGVVITFSQPVKYVGFDWQAGNAGNTVTFRSGNSDIASLTTDSVTALVGTLPSNYASDTASVRSQSGLNYFKKYYFGNPQAYASLTPTSPNSGASSGEPFAYIHAFALEGQSFDSIRLSGSGFEFDNLTVSTQDVPIRDSTVFIYNVASNCTSSTYDAGGGYTTIRYSGTSLCSFNPPDGVTTVSIVAVAGGGGGGGTCVGGGGGAGGFYRNENFSVTTLIRMRIGQGGAGGSQNGCSQLPGTNGETTTITMGSTVVSLTGGGGGGAFSNRKPGANGGSGGGGAGSGSSETVSGGTGISGQGSSGGNGRGGITGAPGGGGGGYTSAGAAGSAGQGGAGGSGISITLFGAVQRFAGGGGGASDSAGGLGGESCGGRGTGRDVSPNASTAATGYGCGGGGGDGSYAGTSGSAGVVFITYFILQDTTSCSGQGSLINGDFENLPSGLTTEATNTNGNETIGSWHGYASNSNPKQILFVYGQDDTHTSTYKLNGWDTTASDGYIEIQRVDGAPRTNATQNADAVGVRPASGNFHAELNARELSTLYQDVSTIPGSTIRWSVKHRARLDSRTDTMEVRIGSTSSQTAQTVTSRRSPNNDVYLVPTYDTTVDSGFTPTTSIGTTLANGWREYRGSYTVPSGQTTTRFAFAATGGSTTSGNLLDDIQFSPLVACPATFSVVAGRTIMINPFDLNLSGNATGNDSGDSYGWSNAFVTETVTATSGSVSRGSYGGVSNRVIQYSAPSTPGNYSMSFTIANPDGDLSRSNYTINVVPDSKSRAPSDVPIDPRTTNYNMNLAQVTTATTNVLACIQQSDASGTVISGALRFDVGASGSTDTLLTYSGETVTVSSDRSNSETLTGTLKAVNTALTTLRIYRSDTPARLSSVFYIRFSSVVVAPPLYNPSNCTDSLSPQIKILTVRPIRLTQIRSFTVLPKNGSQNN